MSDFRAFDSACETQREITYCEMQAKIASLEAELAEAKRADADLMNQLCEVVPLSRQRQERVELLERAVKFLVDRDSEFLNVDDVLFALARDGGVGGGE